jgi:PKD repeat protein
VAFITCTNVALEVTCDGSSSARAVMYTFAFESGPTVSGTTSTASYAYPGPGTYTITLTVADQHGATSTDSATVTVP